MTNVPDTNMGSNRTGIKLKFGMTKKNFLLYSFLVLVVFVLLSKFAILRNRWSDQKAYNIFSSKNVPLSIYDTIINNHQLHYAVSGSENLPTLVFIHGSPGSWMNYAKFMWDTTLRKKYRMVSIDRPGFGYSDFGKPLRLNEQCDIILPVLRSLKTVQPMFLCGHSLGGPVAIQLAADDPKLFNTIVIAAGSIDVNQEKNEKWRKIMDNKPLYWLLPGAFAPSNKEILYFKKDLVNLQQQFEKISCKVHFIHGSADTWVPIENISYGQKMLVNASGITIDTLFEAGHQIPWKNRTEFTKMLLELY
jgi:pimeloyl-ACP methyl ester carboxylesterase